MRPAFAFIHLKHLQHNYRLLAERAGTATVMAVIKANAYGHGMEHIAPALYDCGCRHFAVTDAEEGVQLRALLPGDAAITLLSGIFDKDDARLTSEYRLNPVVFETSQIDLLQQAGYTGQVWVKVDTGMQRLGADEPEALHAYANRAGIAVAGIMSHLACADTPEHPLNHAQADEFRALRRRLGDLPGSLLNSAGLVALPEETLAFVRPGIALYGSEPVAQEPLGLKPVMELTGQVMQVRDISRGTTLSYGASYTAPQDMRIAVVSMGYADGLPRALSNRGVASYQGQRLPIVGRICMDYCLLDCSNSALQAGDAVSFWGEAIHIDEVAAELDTIAYTLMTGVGRRVQRKAVP
jgi:alanine racemase